MNRITNKQYLIDITIKTLQTQQPNHPTKVKCEVHYADDSYLRIQLQPMLRNGIALFCDERIRIPFSSEVSIVFKLIKPNKKQAFLGHYLLEIEKLLTQKQYYIKIKDKLEESETIVDFQCRIIDKQLLCQSDTEEPELDPNIHSGEKSIITWAEQIHKIKVNPPLSELNVSSFAKRVIANVIPMHPEEYSKAIREAEDILKKKQLFSQRHDIIHNFSRDKFGMLKTKKINQLEGRLNECRRQKFNQNLVFYMIVCVVSFLIGAQM